MKNFESSIQKLQHNLQSFRKLAGWTSEELGHKVGVTKQTISNLETGRTKLTKPLYIAIRTVLDFESKTNENLSKALYLLLDNDTVSEQQQTENEEKVKAVAAATSAGVSGLVLGGLLGVATYALGSWLTSIDKEK